MKSVLIKDAMRGHINRGWVDTKFIFTYMRQTDPERTHFGKLCLFNEDLVDEGMGFGMHAHNNMEIVSIPLEGALEHKDSMGNVAIIRQNDVQIMSAGTGVYHSEYNKNKNQKVRFLQIWIFPKVRNITPRYDQKTFKPEDGVNKLQQIISPSKTSEGMWINQDAWFHLGKLKKDFSVSYDINLKSNGVYAFVIEGNTTINGQLLNKRNGFGVWDVEKLDIVANSDTNLLLIEVPMNMDDL